MIVFVKVCLGGFTLVALGLSIGIAFAEALTGQSLPTLEAVLEARMDAAVREAANDPRFGGQTEQQRRESIEFVLGNVLFALTHEVGHMLISRMNLPVLGREEDAADAFAVVTRLNLGNAFSDRVLIASASGWFMSEARDKREKIKTIYYDEHGLDEQRAYNVVCLMVGSSPEKFAPLADKTKLPDERRRTCHFDYSNASWSWETVLTPHIRKPDQPKTQITAVYDDSKEYEFLKRAFAQMRLLETLAEHLSDRYVWPEPVGFEMTACGEPNARWAPLLHKVVVCYELAADFVDLHRGYARFEIELPSPKIARNAKRY